MRSWQLTLHRRVAAAFGLGALLITGVLATVTWNLTTSYLLDQREASAARQAEVNVRLVSAELASGGDGLGDLLPGLTTDEESSVMVRLPQGWLTSGRQIEPAALPRPLLDLAEGGVPAQQRVIVDRVPVVAVALPLPDGSGLYVELFPLIELDRTFHFLSSVLLVAVAASAVLGVTVGSWASRRALRPLSDLTEAASRMARGDLQARLVAQDDPELASLASAFNATADALEARVLRDARFAGDVSHELRSPLTTMANAAEVLRRRRGELSDTADRALELLLAEIDRFQQMVVDLLEISRDDQDSGERGQELEPVDVGELARTIVGMRAGDHPELEVVEPSPVVLADRRRLDRVVQNLLDNAEKYGGGAIRVAVLDGDGRVRLEVDDAGPGVPEDQREQVFERFSRGGSAGRRGQGTGSGLGLALVAQHARHHDGEAWVEERPGGGARFVVELPGVLS